MSHEPSANAGQSGITFVLLQLILGPLAGVIVGLLGGLVIEKAVKKDWMNDVFLRISSFS